MVESCSNSTEVANLFLICACQPISAVGVWTSLTRQVYSYCPDLAGAALQPSSIQGTCGAAIPSRSTGPVDISLDSAVSPGVLQGSVSIAFEGLQAAVNATLTARVQELAVRFSSSSVDFGKVALETERTRKVTVCNLTGVSTALKGQVRHDAHSGVFTVEPAAVSLPPHDEVSCIDDWFSCHYRGN